MAESLEIRRDGMRFFAEAFSHPETLREPGTQEESQAFTQRTEAANARLEQALTDALSVRGFEQREDGQFVVDC